MSEDTVTCLGCGEELDFEDADGEYWHPDCLRETEPACWTCGAPVGRDALATYTLSGDLVHETCPAA